MERKKKRIMLEGAGGEVEVDEEEVVRGRGGC